MAKVSKRLVYKVVITLLTKLSGVDLDAESVPRAVASDGFANSRSLPLAVPIRTIVEQPG
jgi:hypothetical protein